MFRRFIHSIIIASVLFGVSCERENTWDIKPSARLIVADCIITNEHKQQELRLFYSNQELNQIPEPVSGAIIKVNRGVFSVNFIEDSVVPGLYRSEVPFMASAGRDYMLTIQVDGIQDTAIAEMTAISPMESISISASDSLFRFNYAKSNRPSMMEVYYNWSSDTAYSKEYGATQASETFYSLDNIDVSKEFAPAKLTILFPHQTQIIRRKYSLSEEHQEFIRAMLMETEWRGGLFDEEQGNVPTNFKHGIKGWFAACMVLTDTTEFN
jgi:hypothetical protein